MNTGAFSGVKIAEHRASYPIFSSAVVANTWTLAFTFPCGHSWPVMGIPLPLYIYILNSCPTQGRVEVWDAMKPLYYRSVSSKGAGRPRLMHHHKGGWNETKMIEMSVEKWWNEICDSGNREKPCEKPTQTPFRPPQNPHGRTEMWTRDPSGGKRASNCLRHKAAYTYIYDNYWEKNLYLSWDLNLRSPVLRTGIFTIRPVRHIHQLRNKLLSHSYFCFWIGICVSAV